MNHTSLQDTVAIILAAGVGSRLRPLTDDCPKCLVSLGKETILGRAVRLLEQAGVVQVIVATGYRAEMTQAALADSQLDVKFVDNPDYATTQNVVSFARSLTAVKPGCSMIKLDGDVVFEQSVLEHLVRVSTQGAAVLVDRSGQLGAEEMKILAETSTDGKRARIRQFGKGLDPARAYGESIGIEWFHTETVAHLNTALGAAVSEGRTDVYYEDVYNDLLDRVTFWAHEISPEEWIEIDDGADLARARARLGV